jgi:Protein of unknown function (DUF1217)
VSFSPIIAGSGYSAWSFLTRTLPAQKKAFLNDAVLQRDEAYFRDRIGSVDSADKLIGDRRLLSVALTAFGLDGDINGKAFIRKVLTDGTLDPAALSNRLADKRYLEFSKAFGFGDFAQPHTLKSDFPDKILALYEARRFESAVGEQSSEMRLALNAQRELGALATRAISENTKWFTAMGSPPLRTVLQTAFGLPASFAGLDIDKQLETLKSASDRLLGSSDPAQFTDPAQVGKLVRLYLVRAQVQTGQSGGASAALSLLTQPRFLSRYV